MERTEYPDILIALFFTVVVISFLLAAFWRRKYKDGDRIGDMPKTVEHGGQTWHRTGVMEYDHTGPRFTMTLEDGRTATSEDGMTWDIEEEMIAAYFEEHTVLLDVKIFKGEKRGAGAFGRDTFKWYIVHGHYLHNGYVKRKFSGTCIAELPRGLTTINNKINAAIKAAPQWNY